MTEGFGSGREMKLPDSTIPDWVPPTGFGPVLFYRPRTIASNRMEDG
jgi:hypothetical protein